MEYLLLGFVYTLIITGAYFGVHKPLLGITLLAVAWLIARQGARNYGVLTDG